MPVTVERIEVSGKDDYKLTVRPEKSPWGLQDPYMGRCNRFTVQGTYSSWHSRSFTKEVTRKNHREAIALIQKAQATQSVVNFGWVGTGFVPVNANTACVVRSRALWLRTSEGTTMVLSFHNAI